jgi:galactokinase
MISMTKAELEKEFRQRFNKDATHFFFCPGRVNLIGEHIDYNGGEVMPCAITAGTYLAIAKNTDNRLRFQCLNFSETTEPEMQPGFSKTGKEWFNYPLGVIHHLLQQGHLLTGVDMLYYGNLPIGAGLSSSASIEVLTGFAFSELFDLGISRKELALLGKKAENEFIGVNSGIMDQFAVAMGKKEKAILLNCDTLDYTYLPFVTEGYVLAIINSNKQRTLADSKYNQRFAECRAALKQLQRELPIAHLCEISSETFSKHSHLINDEQVIKRAVHVISENERVKAACAALQASDIRQFGQLMYASHDSLKDFYEVSGKELDTIVEFCRQFSGCIGARMTGAGFGGCAIALVQKDSFDDFAKELTKYYMQHIGYAPEVFASEIGEGVRDI